MPRSGLSSRLKNLRSSKQKPSDTYPVSGGADHKIPGFSRISEFVYHRSAEIEQPPPVNSLSGLFLPGREDINNLVYFDLETTGLSTGAGTLAFLAGFGRHKGDILQIDQYFLSDFPGEGEFLQLCKEALPAESCLVSYNGRAFDEKLLTSRGLMKGIRFSFSAHYDLLYASRRLWRRIIGSCSLGNIESLVLGLNRTEDLPGVEVPDRWFDFLRSRDPGLLQEVFSHHFQDIASLVLLLAEIEKVLSAPEKAEKVDRRALGVWLLSRGDLRGERLLRLAWEAGDYSAGFLFSLNRKRAGDWASASDLWGELAQVKPEPDVCEELAKYYEHRKGEPDKALVWANLGYKSLTPGVSRIKAEGFLHRIRRLEKKSI